MYKLIEKIVVQSEGLLRGNISKIIGDLDALAKEKTDAEIPVTLKIVLKKGAFYTYTYESSISWNKSTKFSDESEIEIYDPNQPELFEMENKKNVGMPGKIGDNLEIVKPRKARGKKAKDTMSVEKNLDGIQEPCKEECVGCCQCENEECRERLTVFGNAQDCNRSSACSAECPRLVVEGNK